MSDPRFIGVIDIGKTNVKFAIVDLAERSEIAERRTRTPVKRDGPYPHFDVDAIWAFLREAIAGLIHGGHVIEALSVTTHGASAALVDEDGQLTFPVLDYEFSGPDEVDEAYGRARPAFEESFTPALPDGLNLGKQLYWQARLDSAAFARTRWILTYPQYWSYRLTGVPSCEITSIGCHTDLWNFRESRFSSLVESEGWAGKFPPMRPAATELGPVRQELVGPLNLPAGVPVHVGIHDSNASLLPHILTRTPPFAVVSTGTWVVVCSPGGDLNHLEPVRDSFSNIDALGRSVPSARFMGGREYSQLTSDAVEHPSQQVVDRILDEGLFLLPSLVKGCGPFPDAEHKWTFNRTTAPADLVYAVVSFYLAQMTGECLELTGAHGAIIVEGPFAENQLYLEMLQAATRRKVLAQTDSATGTSIGAALLATADVARIERPGAREVQARDEARMAVYARQWREMVNAAEMPVQSKPA